MRSPTRFPGLLLIAALILSGPLAAQTVQDLPFFTHEDAITCLAYKLADLETSTTETSAEDSIELAFWDRLIAVKATADEGASRDESLAAALTQMRALHEDLDRPGTRDEADEILTGIGKMCWYQALIAPGVGPFAED